MEFDSHTSDVVEYTVTLINDGDPGSATAADFAAPEGDELVAAVRDAVPAEPRAGRPTEAAVAGRMGRRLRAVVEKVDAGDVDTACTDAEPDPARRERRPHACPGTTTSRGTCTSTAWTPTGPPSWAGPMATGLAIVLGNAAIDRLGLCNAPACDRVYIDVSRNGTRRFCSTACQNRVKAAAFRAAARSPEELCEAGEVVGVDVVDVGCDQFVPNGVAVGARYVRGRPEADPLAGLVGGGHDLAQLRRARSAGISPMPVQANRFVQLSETSGVSAASSPGPRSSGLAIRPS